MVKVSKGTSNGTCEQANDSDSKNSQKRLKTGNESADEWSVDSMSDASRVSKERPVSHASDEGKIKYCCSTIEKVTIVIKNNLTFIDIQTV